METSAHTPLFQYPAFHAVFPAGRLLVCMLLCCIDSRESKAKGNREVALMMLRYCNNGDVRVL